MAEPSAAALRGREMYRAGHGLGEIAAVLGVHIDSVRRWRRWFAWGEPEGSARAVHAPGFEEQDELARAVEHNDELTDRQKEFCLRYLRSFNATAAYQRAYGCSYTRAMSGGPALRKKPAVQAELRRLKTLRARRLLADGDDVVEQMMRIAFADITDFVEWGPAADGGGEAGDEPRLRPSAQVDGTLVAEVRKTRDSVSVKLCDRMAALKWLAEYFELNPDGRHRRAFDQRRLELQQQRAESALHGDPGEDGPGAGPAQRAVYFVIDDEEKGEFPEEMGREDGDESQNC